MGQNIESSWPKDWSAQIGRTLKELRGIAGLSAQVVSDRCGELGYPIPRSTIANIESGRKEAVPVHEISVLAKAVGVPPMALLFPLGSGDQASALPGESVHPWTAWRWFCGDDAANGQVEPVNEAARHVNGPLVVYTKITDGVVRWLGAQSIKSMSLKVVGMPDIESISPHIDEMSAKIVNEIADYADFIVDAGIGLPPMPEDLRSILQVVLDERRKKRLDLQRLVDDQGTPNA